VAGSGFAVETIRGAPFERTLLRLEDFASWTICRCWEVVWENGVVCHSGTGWDLVFHAAAEFQTDGIAAVSAQAVPDRGSARQTQRFRVKRHKGTQWKRFIDTQSDSVFTDIAAFGNCELRFPMAIIPGDRDGLESRGSFGTT
jgi:hypothetical protein